MEITLTQDQAKFLIEAISQKPVQTTLGSALQGLKFDNQILDLISKIQVIANKYEAPKTSAQTEEQTGTEVASQEEQPTRENDSEIKQVTEA